MIRWRGNASGARALALAGIAAAGMSLGCGGDSAPLPGAKSEANAPEAGVSREAAIATPPSNHPTPGSAMGDAGSDDVAVETGAELPLKLTGIGSKQELDHALSQIQDPPSRASFEQGFRYCFSNDRSKRRFNDAVPLMEQLLTKMPNFAPAYRVLAYAHFNLSFDMPKATQLYEKAVEIDPNYGEAHYALAFMLTQSDMPRARTHFDKAMALGVPDERDLKTKFFQ